MSTKVLKRTSSKISIRSRRRRRIRSGVEGSMERPRLCVTKTNRRIVAQIIDDSSGRTLVAESTPKGKVANVTLATELGKSLGSLAKSKGILKVVFDRSGNLYHGRVAAVASGARESGLQF
jgi:large subunit ribosomal protein L18